MGDAPRTRPVTHPGTQAFFEPFAGSDRSGKAMDGAAAAAGFLLAFGFLTSRLLFC